MAPIKFEEHIKESLEKRRIEPSSKSWDALSSQLDDSSKKKSPIWLWMGVAASFAGLVFLATTFFNSTNNTVSTEHNIVKTTVNEQDGKTKTTDSYKESKEATTIAEETTITPTINTNTKKVSTQSKPKASQKYDIAINEESSIVNETEALTEIALQEPKFQFEEVSEDIALNNELTDEHIENLLKAASARNANKMKNENLSVDPSALLSDAEIQVERTFREKVFTVIKSGLEEVKSSVVTRAQKF
jgi:hypothetical protein